MIGYILIVLFTLINLGESVIVRTYGRKHGSGGLILSAITSLFASVFFLVTDKGGFYAPTEMIWLAVINACLIGAGFYGTFAAYQNGPYGLTRLVSGFYLLFTIFYGIVFLKESTTVMTYIGIAMVIAAMVLINYKKSDEKSEKRGSLKWLFWVLASTVANGFIGIITRYQQIRFEDACSNEFQFVSFLGGFVLLALIGLVVDKDKLGRVIKTGSLYGFGAGILNGAKNFLTLVIYLYLPLSIVSPLKMGLSLVGSFAVAFLMYKERYTKKQLLGVAIGAAAIIILTI